jgi:hypothetical protein
LRAVKATISLCATISFVRLLELDRKGASDRERVCMVNVIVEQTQLGSSERLEGREVRSELSVRQLHQCERLRDRAG